MVAPSTCNNVRVQIVLALKEVLSGNYNFDL